MSLIRIVNRSDLARSTSVGHAGLKRWIILAGCLSVLTTANLTHASSPLLPEVTITSEDLPDCAPLQSPSGRAIRIDNQCDEDLVLTQYLQDMSAEPNTVTTSIAPGDFGVLKPEVDDGIIWEVITWRMGDDRAGQVEVTVKFVTYPCPTPFTCLGCQTEAAHPLDPVVIVGSILLTALFLRRRRSAEPA